MRISDWSSDVCSSDLSALPQTGDRIFHDALIHASAHDGMRLARCDAQPVPHNNADAVADAIAAWRRACGTGRPWIIVASLYSMAGDRAPIADMARSADAHGGFLVPPQPQATGMLCVPGGGTPPNRRGGAEV